MKEKTKVELSIGDTDSEMVEKLLKIMQTTHKLPSEKIKR